MTFRRKSVPRTPGAMRVSTPSRLLFALSLPVLALALQWALWPWLDPYVWFLFFPAVFFSARLDGLRGGLAATVLSVALAWYFFIPPQMGWAIDNVAQLPAVGLFLVMGYLFSVVHERLNRARRNAERRFEASFEWASVGIAQLALDGRWLAANRKLCDIIGYDRAELLTRTSRDMTHPDDLAVGAEQLQRMLAREIDSCAIEKRYVRKDGRPVWIKVTVALCLNPQGEPDHFISMVEDIGGRKASEAALHENREQLQLFIEHAPAALAMFDRDMRYVAVSRRWKTDYGLGDRDLVGLSHYEVFPDLPEQWKAAHRSGLAGQTVHVEEDRFERADGSVQWLHWEIWPWLSADGEVAGIALFTEDITARKAADEALRESERRLRIAQEGAHVGIWEWDVRAGRLYWSSEYERLYGVPPGGARSNSYWRSRVHPDDLPRIDAAWDRHFLHGEPFEVEFRIRREDGETRWMYGLGAAQFDASGKAVLLSGINLDITERKKAEQALRDSREQLMQAVEIAHLGSWELDHATKTLRWSDEVFRIFGLRPEHFGGREEDFMQRVHPDDREAVARAFDDSLRSNRDSYDIEHRIVREGNGEVRLLHEKCRHVRDGAGSIVRSVGMVHDITERVRAEEAVRRSEARLAAFSDAAFEGIVLSESGRIVDCNAQFARMMSSSIDELKGRTVEELIAPEHRARVMENIRLDRESDIEHDLLCADGRRLTVEVRGRPGGSVGGATRVSVLRDVTAQRQAEGLLRLVTDAAPVLISYVDSGQRYRMVNARYEEWFGLQRGEVVGRTVSELLGEPAYAAAAPWVERALAGERVSYEAQMDILTLGRRQLAVSYIPHRLADGTIPGFCAVVQDLTERQLAEDALRRSEERYRTVIEHAADAVLVASPDGRLAYANPQASSMLGYSVDELCEMALPGIVHAHHVEAAQGLFHDLLERGHVRTELDLRCKDGSSVTTDINAVRLPCGDFFGVCRDITERRLAQVAVLRARDAAEQASQAKSRFLSRMSHELRTPMNAILGFAQLLKSDTAHPLDALQRENVGEILHAGRHLLDLINEVLDLSRIEVGQLEVKPARVDLDRLLRECQNLTRPEADARGIRWVDGALPAAAFVVADPVRLKQVLLNLLSNAVKYNHPAGTVSVDCVAQDGAWVIGVIDSGPGLTAAQQARLFTPFERLGTDRAEGTGIGLALSKHLVELMGGRIGVLSVPGEGCRFWLRLPMADSSPHPVDAG